MNEHDERLTAQHVAADLPDYVNNRLPDGKRAEVEAHLRTCLACRRECDDWRTLATAVRAADSVASPDMPFDRAWSDLRTRLPVAAPDDPSDSAGWDLSDESDDDEAFNGASPGVSPADAPYMSSAQHGSRHGLRWAVVVAASVVLIVSGFAALFYQVGGARRPSDAATPTPTTPALTWVDVALPVVPAGYAPAHLSVAPSDSNVAYACAIAPDTPNARPAVWRSGDRVRTWTRATDIPFTPSDIQDCVIAIDQIESRIAVATIAWGKPDATGGNVHSSNFVTFDAGASWREVGFGADESLLALATWRGKTYSTLGENGFNSHIVVSDDQMKTGKALAAPFSSTAAFIVKLWIEPAHGLFVLEAQSQTSSTEGKLWSSDDQGQTWKALPSYSAPLDWIAIRPPRSGAALSYCGVPFNGDGDETGLVALRLKIVCTFDGGVTWRQSNDVASGVTSGSGGIVGIAHDGSVFGSIDEVEKKSTTLYWLPPGKTQWQTVEHWDQNAFLFVIPTGNHDVLWRGILEQTADGAVYHFATATY
jgi:anti-sigma factor RsiW